jgi:hypothetical protein
MSRTRSKDRPTYLPVHRRDGGINILAGGCQKAMKAAEPVIDIKGKCNNKKLTMFSSLNHHDVNIALDFFISSDRDGPPFLPDWTFPGLFRPGLYYKFSLMSSYYSSSKPFSFGTRARIAHISLSDIRHGERGRYWVFLTVSIPFPKLKPIASIAIIFNNHITTYKARLAGSIATLRVFS